HQGAGTLHQPAYGHCATAAQGRCGAMSLQSLSGIAGILFDKDGTLIRYDESWGPVNREAARIAAAGNPDLEPGLLLAAGMDPESGLTRADSLLAAGNAAEIAVGFAAA